MLSLKSIDRSKIILSLAVIVLAVAGLILYGKFSNYAYLSNWNLTDLIRAKFWSISWLLIGSAIVFFRRKSPDAPAWAVFAVSAYFVILYGLLFKGTQYGMNGHWGDNGNRLAEICKIMAYNSPFQDWYLKGLPSFYPPGWLWIMAIYAKLLHIEAYQTIKYGYLLIFTVYPWLLYFAWRKLITPAAAAAVVVATLFFAYRGMDGSGYENITAALFLPWWLYYFEGGYGSLKEAPSLTWSQYATGAIFGAALFVVYYYWFFLALVAVPATLLYRGLFTRSWAAVWIDVRHKLILMSGVMLLAAVYWLPLLVSIIRYGSESSQHLWWGRRHADLLNQWPAVSFESIWIIVGVFCAFYLWDHFGRGRLAFFYFGGLLTVLLDRLYNLAHKTLQSRVVLEHIHVFVVAPLAIGVIEIWRKFAANSAIRRGMVGVGLLAAIITANAHTEAYTDDAYRIGIGQRVPIEDLAVFDAVNTRGTVFLTANYLEACYRPYYMFIPANNMTSHTAGRYDERVAFLQSAAAVTEPELLAYVLRYNRYDAVDYVYLPFAKETDRFELTIYQSSFNQTAVPLTVTFSVEVSAAPSVFVKRHNRGMYELTAPTRSAEVDRIIQERYPALTGHLSPASR